MANSLIEKCKNYDFEKLFDKMGYAYFTKSHYNLNLIGVRKSGTEVTNSFDDAFVMIYKDDNDNWVQTVNEFTTDPGKSVMKSPTNSKGCAILVPGQYRGAYKIGYHKGQYRALCLNKNLKVYRDNNKDTVYDMDPKTIDEGMFGINIHKAGTDSTLVDGWSAGCQVFKKSSDFDNMMNMCDKQIANGLGETFTYTLIDEADMV